MFYEYGEGMKEAIFHYILSRIIVLGDMLAIHFIWVTKNGKKVKN